MSVVAQGGNHRRVSIGFANLGAEWGLSVGINKLIDAKIVDQRALDTVIGKAGLYPGIHLIGQFGPKIGIHLSTTLIEQIGVLENLIMTIILEIGRASCRER